MPGLASDLPMHLMGAQYNPADKELRFLFYYPDETDPDNWRQGIGAVLLCKDAHVKVPGDQDEPEYEIALERLPEYTDKLTGDRGIPCGIGFSKCDAQICDYDGPEWMFHITASSYGYCGNVKLNIKETEE